MMGEVSLPLVAAISLLSILATLAASWGVLRFQSSRHEVEIHRIEGRLEQLASDLAAFKLEAARRFVTDEMLVKVEERIVTAIDRLADRIDRVIENRTRGRTGA